ncbi:hypothetical protein [Polymorphospora rubra]|uniref:hypothetical protein n=1 Tax=Polymorphospora rubra TaxID=338584 RepID=UPI00341143D1
MWDLDAGKVVHELPAPATYRVWWFPDDRSLLACADNGAVREMAAPDRLPR